MILFSRWQRLLFVCSCLLLLIGSVSCSSAPSPTTGTVLPTHTPASTPTSTIPITASPDCPASGQGRAANMPGITLGSQQEVVSYRNASGSATINEFDVQSKTLSPIVRVDGETIHSAQISQDGQWVFMVAQTNSAWALQLVRVDGQDLQTLYCASAIQKLSAQWSPNQQQIIFSQISAHETQFFLLNPISGTLQAEYTDADGGDMEPLTWLDNTHVYLGIVNSGLLYEPADLYVLDTGKGAHQPQSDLKMLLGVGDNLWSFDCSLDGKTTYSTISEEPPRANTFKSTIFAQPALAVNFTNPIFISRTIYITEIRVVNATTLMILAEDPENSQSSANGLYTVHTDGSGLKQLVSESSELSSSSSSQPSTWTFNVFSQYTWSNFSRNGEYYVDGLSYGSFNGGLMTTYGSSFWGDALVGWTTK